MGALFNPTLILFLFFSRLRNWKLTADYFTAKFASQTRMTMKAALAAIIRGDKRAFSTTMSTRRDESRNTL